MGKNNIHQLARRKAIEAAASKVEEEQAALEEAEPVNPSRTLEGIQDDLKLAHAELDEARDRFNNATPEEKDALSEETQKLVFRVDFLQNELEAFEDEANAELS